MPNDNTDWMNYREPRNKKEFIQSLTIDREFQLAGGRWVSGGIGHLNLPELKQIYTGSRRTRGKEPEPTIGQMMIREEIRRNRDKDNSSGPIWPMR